MNPRRLRQITIHEAGHALAYHLLAAGSIISARIATDRDPQDDPEWYSLSCDGQVIAHRGGLDTWGGLVAFTAGDAAEAVLHAKRTGAPVPAGRHLRFRRKASHDAESADLALFQRGWDITERHDAWRAAAGLVEHYWAAVDALARALEARPRLEGAEVHRILEAAGAPAGAGHTLPAAAAA